MGLVQLTRTRISKWGPCGGWSGEADFREVISIKGAAPAGAELTQGRSTDGYQCLGDVKFSAVVWVCSVDKNKDFEMAALRRLEW